MPLDKLAGPCYNVNMPKQNDYPSPADTADDPDAETEAAERRAKKADDRAEKADRDNDPDGD